MKLLLDTHVLLWFSTNPSRLRPDVVDALRSNHTTILISIASWWELGIKHALGRLECSVPPNALRARWLEYENTQELAITAEHVFSASSLPHHHRDPFDRLLLAQARIESAMLVSADNAVFA